MKKKYLGLFAALTCALLLVCQTAWADEPAGQEPDTVEVATATYDNAAQAQHDANLAVAAYEKIDAELAEIDEKLSDETIGSDEKATLLERENELLAQRTDIDNGAIAQMRADGMGWGEIAHALGVHPGVLGLGHAKKGGMATEIAVATSLDMQSGKSVGHGHAGKADDGMGKEGKGNNSGHGQNNDKGGQGNKGGNGNGGGHGNSGGGNGNGNGKSR